MNSSSGCFLTEFCSSHLHGLGALLVPDVLPALSAFAALTLRALDLRGGARGLLLFIIMDRAGKVRKVIKGMKRLERLSKE